MPEPSQLVLLEQLRGVDTGAKVRFLGCVDGYDVERGTIVLKKRHPTTDPDAPIATINAGAILAYINQDLLATGAWINVVGYVSAPASDRKQSSARIDVTATMVWSAGAIRLERYESAVRGYQRP